MRVTVTPRDEERLVGLMARERPRSTVVAAGGDVVTVGGGGGGADGSDGDSSESLKEISADDFKKESSAAAGGGAGGGGALGSSAAAAARSRSWVAPHMGYMSRSYAPAFHSFAWAQAVQKKPLVPAATDAEEDEVEHAVDASDEEMEEGEIEEGEAAETSSSPPREHPETIDLDSDASEKSEPVAAEGGGNTAATAAAEEEVDFDQRVGSILEELEMVSIEEAEKSFDGACTRLRTCFESLKPLFPEDGSPMPMLEPLVQQAFVAIDIITTVANSHNLPRREQNKNMLLKLLFHIKNRYSDMLTPDQRDELDSRVRHLVFEEKDNANDLNTNGGTKANAAEPPGQVSSGRLPFESGAANPFSGSSSLPRLEIPARNKISPLLDLHADYDENSLPSPTRDNAPSFLLPRPIGFGAFPMAPEKPSVPDRVEPVAKNSLYPSINDPLKAVSSYQQKYGQKSAFPCDDLPSPTPSGDEGKSAGKGSDIFGEVSSFSIPKKTALPSTSQMPASRPSTVGSSSDGYPGGPPGYSKQVEQLATGPNPILKATSKSRDPRLRFLNRDSAGGTEEVRPANFGEPKEGNLGGGLSVNNRKNKAVDEPKADENMLKRLRSGTGDPRDMLVPTGNPNLRTGNKLINNTSAAINSCGTNIKILQPPQTTVPQSSAASGISLPAVLKDIAGNPAMIMHLIQMEQQKMSASEPQLNIATTSDISSAMSMVTAGTVLPPGSDPKTTEVAQIPSVRPQVSMQQPPLNDAAGIIRMKPRDPRRILHNNIAKTNGITQPDSQGSKDHLTNNEQQLEQHQTTLLPSQQGALLSNMTRSSIINSKTVDPVSNSQLAATALMAPAQQASCSSRSDPRLMVGQNAAPATTLETGQPIDPYGAVDHLLGGYDEQQKALIQKERARRIEEQRELFRTRKLCLVLDLDHTLLNSAKFGEVDPIHDEILQKKEEQDRCFQDRHLYRLQHMAMWTKLRPGIWNFLRKASKLFELHLYTMGNKLYATEMAKLLDPRGELFAGRVISRGDDSVGDPFDSDDRVPKSKDLDGVLGMESAVVIIDDSIRVWPHNKHNLIVVERYMYFPCSRRQFGLAGPSLLEIDRDERPEDGTLASCLAVIERIHQNFFSHPNLNEADVRSILASEQRRILAGCCIVFSRIFPVGYVNPHLHSLWQTAEQFGAVCTLQIDDRVTHVVANSLGTDKVNWALATGRFVVHPGWVEASALLYRRANEHDFAVK